MANNKTTFFVVHVNGKHACTATVGGFGVLSAILSCVNRRSSRRPRGLPKDLWSGEELTFAVDSLVSGKLKKDDKSIAWLKRNLEDGDEVRILIKKSGSNEGDADVRRDVKRGRRT